MHWRSFIQDGIHFPFSLLTFSFVVVLQAIGPSVTYAQDIIRSDHLCPDPLFSGREEKMMLINHELRVMKLRVTSLIKKKLEDVPCNFDLQIESQLDPVHAAGYPHSLSIKAITVSSTPWNFTGSKNCTSFIKFLVPDAPIAEKVQLCRMFKNNGVGTMSKNSTHPPSIWSLPGKRMGFLPPAAKHEESETKPLYMTVMYKAYFLSKCVFKVQQYSITSSAGECDHGRIKHQLCGMYSCPEQHEILQKLGYLPFDVVVNTDDFIIQEDGNIYIRAKNGSRHTTNIHAALFSGMTRAISFLFVLSILISCISYQLKPYLRPSSSFEEEIARERSHESHRRCYRRPHSHPVLPFSRSSGEEIQMEQPSPATHTSRPHRPRRYFHHTCHRSVAAAPADLPSYNSHQMINPDYCQPPPPYETIQPPPYTETVSRGGGGGPLEPTPVINPPTTDTSTSNHNK